MSRPTRWREPGLPRVYAHPVQKHTLEVTNSTEFLNGRSDRACRRVGIWRPGQRGGGAVSVRPVSEPPLPHYPVNEPPTLAPAAGAWRSTRSPEGQVSLNWTVRGDNAEVVITWTGDPSPDQADAAADEIGRLVAELEGGLRRDPVRVMLVADHPGDTDHPLAGAVANSAGLSAHRDLFELRRPLPIPTESPLRNGSPPLELRPLNVGADDEAWIRVNNRSFAGHPDQGAENVDTLRSRMAEPWFDPGDFLVLGDADSRGELAGFCWTKVERDVDPTFGEIYVIGVDPRHQGQGLGPALVLAGLDHLASTGVTTAVLYVDESNRAARHLYDRLGFTVHHRRRVHTRPTERGQRP